MSAAIWSAASASMTRRIVVFAIDVSGHGVASAMMTARLAGLLSGSSPDQNLAFRNGRRQATMRCRPN